MSFSYKEYQSLLSSISQSGRNIITVKDWLSSASGGGNYVVMRHDVDRFPNRAVSLAKFEHKYSVKSTYYFRCNKQSVFPEEAVKKICNLGHEVGVHYECLSRCNGDNQSALLRLSKELDIFNKIAPCATIAPHGSPLSKWDNMSFLQAMAETEMKIHFNICGDAVHQMGLYDLYYLTDTGGTWNNFKNNFRDYVRTDSNVYAVPTNENNFISFLKNYPNLVYISTHPERWNGTNLGFFSSFLMDKTVNLLKKSITIAKKI